MRHGPEVFVVGGGLSKAGSIIIDTAAKYYKEYAFHASRETEIQACHTRQLSRHVWRSKDGYRLNNDKIAIFKEIKYNGY